MATHVFQWLCPTGWTLSWIQLFDRLNIPTQVILAWILWCSSLSFKLWLIVIDWIVCSWSTGLWCRFDCFSFFRYSDNINVLGTLEVLTTVRCINRYFTYLLTISTSAFFMPVYLPHTVGDVPRQQSTCRCYFYEQLCVHFTASPNHNIPQCLCC